MSAAKAKSTMLAIEIPRDELAVRIAIPVIGARPREGASAAEALDQMNQTVPGMAANFRAAADAAVIYFHECINAARQPS